MNISAINSVYKNSRVNFGRQYRDLKSARENNPEIIEKVQNALKEEGIYTIKDKNGLLIPINPQQLSSKILEKYPVETIRSCMSPDALEIGVAKTDSNEYIPEALSDIYDESDNISLDM